MARLLKRPYGADTKLVCGGLNNAEIPVHSNIIAARSNVLAEMISLLGEPQVSEKSKVNIAEDKALDIQNAEEEKVIKKKNICLQLATSVDFDCSLTKNITGLKAN